MWGCGLRAPGSCDPCAVEKLLLPFFCTHVSAARGDGAHTLVTRGNCRASSGEFLAHAMFLAVFAAFRVIWVVSPRQRF